MQLPSTTSMEMQNYVMQHEISLSHTDAVGQSILLLKRIRCHNSRLTEPSRVVKYLVA